MAKVLAVANQKGGVGKTTIAVHLSVGLAMAGYRVLLVDADYQSYATQSFYVESGPSHTLAAWLPNADGQVVGSPRISATATDRLDMLPAFLTMADDEWDAIERGVDPRGIADRLRTVGDGYDWVIIDMPPALAFWARVGFMTAHRVLVPLSPAPYPIVGFRQLLTRIEWMRHRGLNPSLRLLGVVLNMVDRSTMYGRNAAEVLEGVVEPSQLFQTRIPMASAIVRAQGKNEPVFGAFDKSPAAMAFVDLIKEVLARWQ